MIDKRCLACNEFQDKCTGGETSCGKWRRLEFTMPTLAPLPVLSAEPEPKPEPEPEEVGETRQQKFQRIGNSRQKQVLESIRKLEHLTSSYYRKRTNVTVYTYEWTPEEALGLIRPIEAALENLKSELIACDMPREHGLIEESK